MQTLEEFYDFMRELHTVRRAITGYYLMQTNNPHQARALEKALDALDELPGGTWDKKLRAGGRETTVTVDYERSEIEKDIFFMNHDRREFLDYLHSHNREFGRTDAVAEELEQTARFLREHTSGLVITDRDGTVNNYCGRYRSSHQSVWNAVYLTRYARARPGNMVILTSAPLRDGGLLDLSAMPSGAVHLAGSKGREYESRTGERGAMEIDAQRAEALSDLNDRIHELLREEQNRTFAVIGSGVQYKFGQTTVARQDIHGSIPESDSERFLDDVRSLVRELDPDETTFGIEDTGKDIEIMLTVDEGHEFSKGDGVAFLDGALDLRIAAEPSLICGDTWSDLPMVEKAVELSSAERTGALFVTDDEDLRAAVRDVTPNAHFVSAPDVLVAAFELAGEDT